MELRLLIADKARNRPQPTLGIINYPKALLAALSSAPALLPHLPFIPTDLAPVLTQHD